jgi:haloalkane dehalogenase
VSSAALPKRYETVRGRRMAYHERGAGEPTLVFLHGNPTSSFVWRDVLPYVADAGRCIAPDLIGMGDSEKLDPSGPESYRFREHRDHLDDLLDRLDVGNRVVLVVHDWGSALGFDWANRNRERVVGIAYMEAIVRPLTWDEWPADARGIFEGFRSPAGEAMILEKNLFVEAVLPAATVRRLEPAEMDEYRRPFGEPGEARRPMLTWPRELPIDGSPEDVTELVSAYSGWLSEAPVPKLFVNADPGSILVGAQREFCRTWPNQTEVTVAGRHFVQEDSAHEIGDALARWLAETVAPRGA